MKINTITILSLFAGTGLAFAQVDGRPLLSLLGLAQLIVSKLVPFLIAVALVVFFYGLVTFIWKGKEGGETLEKSKQLMIYSIGALFVMVSIWGIVAAMQQILGIDSKAKPTDIYVPGSVTQ